MGFEYMTVMVVIIVGVLIYGTYENKKKYELKEQEIQLEREKIALEHKKLDIKKGVDRE
ncbi:MAG: hypothetical protein JJT76_10670 [Clostridiaceae bacterium]|nr:hypothetical protein [Clostridiaceae bacterium]